MGTSASAPAAAGADGLRRPSARPAPRHWCLRGAYAPVEEEAYAPAALRRGRLPEALRGAYCRNGPNRLWNLPTEDSQWHWFFGDGMVHTVRIAEGAATYHNHWLRTGKFVKEQRLGQPVGEAVVFSRSIGHFLASLALEKIGGSGAPWAKTTNNTSLVFHHRKLLALCEADLPLEVRILLDGHAQSAAAYALEGDQAVMNAHPRIDPESGVLHWMNYDVSGLSAEFTYGTVSSTGEVMTKCRGDLPGGKAVMIHDCGITEHDAIVIACPVLVDVANLKPEGCIWRYDPAHGAHVGVFPRGAASGKVLPRWFQIQTCWIFHIANSWREGNVVVLVVVRWDQVSMRGHADQTPFVQAAPTKLYEYRFDLDAGTVSERPLSEAQSLEFPVVHPRTVGRRSRFVWAVGSRLDEPTFHRVFKFDLEANTALDAAFLEGAERLSAGECSLVAGGEAEDEGYLVTFAVHPTGAANSTFWVLDAKSLATLAVLDLPARVPLGFHGLWLSEGQLQGQAFMDEGEEEVPAALSP